jgi:hypothetical protein
MLEETKEFSVMETIKAIKFVEKEMDRKRAQMYEKCQDYVIEEFEAEMKKRNQQHSHFFSKQYHVNV